MIREEAIAILKAFMENPLFNDAHKQAFNIAIHDIKQRHDWDINNLILINKENYEPAEQEPVLDKLRAEIEQKLGTHGNISLYNRAIYDVLMIIDRYKAESEDKE